MKIALVSLEQVWEDKEKNLVQCEYYIKEASFLGVDLIIFPEMTLTGFSTNIHRIAEKNSQSKTILSFQKLAIIYNISIHFGVVIVDGLKALNKSYFIDATGTILKEYSKIHPFTFAGEDKFYNAGDALAQFEYKGYTIGLSICYDLRFPELYSALAKRSDLIINIANWPMKRIDHWNTLLKARAIENQIFIIGVNRIGEDGNSLKYIESSQAINANGENLDFVSKQDMKIIDVDKDWTQDFRNKFLTVKDRKNVFYKDSL